MRGVSRPCRLTLACALGAAVVGAAAPAAQADWTRSFDLSGALAQDADPSVGVSDTGVSLFAWRRTISGTPRIQTRVRVAGGALGSVTTLSSTRPAAHPVVKMNGAGTAAILYDQFDGTDDRLAVNLRPSGGSFGAQQLVSGSGASLTDFDGGIDDAGRVLSVWRSGAGIRARLRAANGTLSATKRSRTPSAPPTPGWR